LTLHDSENERLLGFDNAHPVRQGSGLGSRMYEYQDAVTLLTDFWIEVDLMLKKRSTAS